MKSAHLPRAARILHLHPMRIIYMGTPRFAVPALAKLLDTPRHQIVAAVTQPDRPRGRHLKLAACPVKELAASRGIPVLTPEKIGDAENELRELKPDLIAVAAYGQFIPRVIRELPRACINIHPSLLPKYRGAAPIQWAVANGDAITGVTIMHVAKVMDSGDIILQREVSIVENENAAELEPRLAAIGAEMLLEAIDLIASGNAPRIPQDETKITIARKLEKEDARIDWKLPAEKIYNRIRGYQPWPGAFCTHAGKSLKIYRAQVEVCSAPVRSPGEIIATNSDGPLIACGENALRLLEVQPEGKPAMPASAWLNGSHLRAGDRLG